MTCKHIFCLQGGNELCKKCGLQYTPSEIHVHCWDLDVGRCIGCPERLSHLGCKHSFVTGKAKEFPGSLGTHHSYCRHCYLNYFTFVADQVDHLIRDNQYDRETFHIHCTRFSGSDTGKCIATSPRGPCSYRIDLS